MRLTDPAVSREHIRISLAPNGLRVRDDGSKNGTWLGAVRVRDILLATDASIVLSAAVDRPTRLVEAENAVRGAELSDSVLARAGDAAVGEVHIESDGRGSSAYKQHLLRVHLGRAIQHVMGA